ncbi:MAG: GNAT family N-acetyltransferase [Actinobacteria bacterium]|nr:GNAT family N-acetyltransferase [Actinomycetota bacterium]
MTALIREMRLEEAEMVASLLVEWNEEHLSRFPVEVAGPYRAELADVRSRVEIADVIVAERDGRLLGTVTLVRDAADDEHPWPAGGAVLRLLAVDPAARGQGLGAALTLECMERARCSGASYIALHTAPVMTSARALYERLGFRRAPEHDFEPSAHYGGRGTGSGERWGLAYLLEL